MVCIMDPCKLNPGSTVMQLRERCEHVGIRERGGNSICSRKFVGDFEFVMS